MNHETLERLFVDRESGELSPDVTALLDAYVRHEPELAGEADQIRETLNLAKLALAESPGTALAEMDFNAELPAPAEMRRLLPAWGYGIGMAACFVGGLVIGLLMLPGKNSTPVAKISFERQSVAQTAPASSFWSIQHLHPANTIVASGGDQVIWKSPVRKPEIRRPL